MDIFQIILGLGYFAIFLSPKSNLPLSKLVNVSVDSNFTSATKSIFFFSLSPSS